MIHAFRPPRRHRARTTLTALLAATGLVLSGPAGACTSFLLPTSDGSSVYGRTMEFGVELNSAMIVIPRDYAFTGAAPDGKGIDWTAQYGVVGLNGVDMPIVVDGLNEKGLVGGILYFPGYADYADPAKIEGKTALTPWEVVTWALTRFATVAEVKAAIADVAVVEAVMPALDMVPPFHYTFHDATGASLVVEPLGGELKLYDNPVGVMTNSPTFDWHLTNLRNYVKLSPVNAPPIRIFGDEVSSFGQGSGLLGIPGDPTPPSRFVRAVGYALSVERKPAGVESVRLAEHILNNFDIPIGFVTATDGKEPPDYTQWSAVADLKNLGYYVKTYTDQTLRGVDLTSLELDAEDIVTIPLTPQMEPATLAVPAAR